MVKAHLDQANNVFLLSTLYKDLGHLEQFKQL